MSISSNQQILIIIIIGIIVIFLLYNKSEGFTNTPIPPLLTATNMEAKDTIKVGTNIGALDIGKGYISYGNGDGYGLAIGKKDAPTLQIYDNNWITAKGTIDAQEIAAHTLTATGPIKGWDVNADNNINARGVVTAKKFIATDGSDLPLSREAIQNIASIYNKNDLTATNINTTGEANFTGKAHFTGYGTDTWLPFSDGRNYIRGPTNIDGDTIFTKGVKIPIDLTEVESSCPGGHMSCINPDSPGRIGLYPSWNGGKVRCPNGYYVAGFDQRTGTGLDFYPICRKLPGA